MSLDTAVLTYKNTENIYAKGIETPHGRIKIVFDVIETNIDKMIKKHPKTDFVAYGKVLQGLLILSGSLDLEKGGQLADELNELYAYCDRSVAISRNQGSTKLEKVRSIVSGIAEVGPNKALTNSNNHFHYLCLADPKCSRQLR